MNVYSDVIQTLIDQEVLCDFRSSSSAKEIWLLIFY